MENYSRTAMLIPFTEYQKKVAEKKQQSDKDLALNPDKFKGVKPGAVIGQMYPDLCSQAAHINKDMDELKTKITESVENLFSSMGEEAINIALDSTYEYVDTLLDLPDSRKDAESEITTDGLYDLLNGVYCRIDLAKTLLDLYLKHERMKELCDRQKLAQQNILL